MHNSRFIFYEPRFVLKREEVDGRGKKGDGGQRIRWIDVSSYLSHLDHIIDVMLVV